MYNAVEEGGPRNGVMTGRRRLRSPSYDRAAPARSCCPSTSASPSSSRRSGSSARPSWRAVLDRLESADGRLDLLELSEQLRLERHGFTSTRSFVSRATSSSTVPRRRYLDAAQGRAARRALPRERAAHRAPRSSASSTAGHRVAARAPRPQPADARRDVQQLAAARQAGRSRDESGDLAGVLPVHHDGPDPPRPAASAASTPSAPNGSAATSSSAAPAAAAAPSSCAATSTPTRCGRPTVWVADRFRAAPAGVPTPTATTRGRALTSRPAARPQHRPRRLRPLRPARRPGAVPAGRLRPRRCPRRRSRRSRCCASVADLGAELGRRARRSSTTGSASAASCVDRRRTSNPSATRPSTSFRDRLGIDEHARADRLGRRVLAQAPRARRARAGARGVRRRGARPLPQARAERTGGRARRPRRSAHRCPRPRPAGTTDLSVVVVFYNMQREAARTLHSLSRAYQQDIDDLDYEVIVVENGSDPDQQLGEEFVHSFGPEFRYLDLGDDAEPVAGPRAQPRHRASRRGDALALMIDGAHVLTPGVLHFGMAGLDLYAPAIVATQQWYVGPGQQGDAMADGYDQDYEDELFEQIDWPADGYRLFEIGHFIGERDWFDGLWESNCMFVPAVAARAGRRVRRELLDGRRRLRQPRALRAARLVARRHGGDHPRRGLVPPGPRRHDHQPGRRRGAPASASRPTPSTTRELRGPRLPGPGQADPLRRHHVHRGRAHPGATPQVARRAFFTQGHRPGDPDGLPEPAPSRSPRSSRTAYTEAFWRQPGVDAEPRGSAARSASPPSDLFAYQEIIAEVRPDWIVELRTGNGGRALFLASICELLGHGQVLSVDDRDHARPARAPSPSLRRRPGDLRRRDHPPGRRDRRRRAEGLVVLGSRGPRQRVLQRVRDLLRSSSAWAPT